MGASSFSMFYRSNICIKVEHGLQPLSSETSVQNYVNIRSMIPILRINDRLKPKVPQNESQ
jgi:hypothetical protein